MLVGEVVLLYFLGPQLSGWGFGAGLALLGAGLGLLASQVGNVIMSSVEPSRGGEAGGLQGTSLNLGASLGVALVGSILIAALATNFTQGVQSSASLPDELKQQVSAAAQANANFVSTDSARTSGRAGRAAGRSDRRARGRLLRRATERAAGRPGLPCALRTARAGLGAPSAELTSRR